ncbi:helix-turn-helix domain-containing protein [Rhodococcoides kroppenstedtii]|uniref:helix-turn-helix domain-containing protein n=1 Tax=Rhodococcoides kroppenstedtii TaxID=293050 RepID=UPI003635EAC9
MAAKRVEIGPTGDVVRANIASVRRERGYTLRQLSDRFGEIGRPMSNSSISQIETGSRRVDVDDLVAFAVALDVSPNALLMPQHYDANRLIDAAGAPQVSAGLFWYFLDGMRSLTTQSVDFVVRSQPPFLRPRSIPDPSKSRDMGPLRVARMMQTDGDNVDCGVTIGVGNLLPDEQNED